MDQDETQETPPRSYRLNHILSPGESFSPLMKLGQAAPPARPSVVRPKLAPRNAACAVIAALILGIVFRFPLPAMLVLPFAGLAVVAATRWRWGAHAAPTLFLSAFLTQATSIFVTPFTWWMRFLFFLTLAGSCLLLLVWQTKEL